MLKNHQKDNLDIDVVNLTKTYNANGKRLKIFDNFSFSIERGKLVALVGPSGCGKSTLLRILSGAEIAECDNFYIHPERSQHTASIEQSPALLPWRTAFQNAHLGAEMRKTRLQKLFPDENPNENALNKSVCDDFSIFGLRGFEHNYPEELSGGMQQRVAIIRALQSEPDIMFCDEPFSAIDFVTRLYLTTEFKKRSRNSGCTTIFVTHNIEEAIFLGDRIIVLKGNPCRIVDDIYPQLSNNQEDAVKCRVSPEFSNYFNNIWAKLKPGS